MLACLPPYKLGWDVALLRCEASALELTYAPNLECSIFPITQSTSAPEVLLLLW